MTADAVAAMRRTYQTGPFASVVDAGGADLMMNLGWSADPLWPSTAAERQVGLARLVTARLGIVSGQVVADIGCGKGGLARWVAVRHRAVRVVGVNLDAAQLVVARRAGGTDFVAGMAEHLPLRTGAVDAAVVVELLGHLGDKVPFWAEITRVVRPGGRLVLAAITLARPRAEYAAAAWAHLERLADYFSERAEDVPRAIEIRSALEERGWDVHDEDLSEGVFAPRHDEMCAVLRGLDAPDPHDRAAARAAARARWGADPEILADYLRACTAFHALRHYEYHVFTATR